MAQQPKQQQQQQQQRRRRTRRGGVVALVAAASAAAVLLFSASRVVAAAAAVDITAEESSIASSSASPLSSSSPLGPVFVDVEAAGDDHRVEVSEEELILETGALESLTQVSGEEGSDEAADADARLQAAVEGAQAAAAAVAPVCSSVESCLALCPTDNFLVAGGATEGSVEESVSFLSVLEERSETVSRERERAIELRFSFLASHASSCRSAKGYFWREEWKC